MFTIRRFATCFVTVKLMLCAIGVVSAQNYPSKPVRIVTSGIGGSSDFASRLIAAGIANTLGQPITVGNRPTGVIPGEVVSKASPDGYTLLVAGNSFWTGSLLQNTPYDPVRDFAPITLATRAPAILVVHPSLPVKSVKDLVVLAKARPKELNY
jgi:tripartite-type tricarboxylate transporter receptor subunit TctC